MVIFSFLFGDGACLHGMMTDASSFLLRVWLSIWMNFFFEWQIFRRPRLGSCKCTLMMSGLRRRSSKGYDFSSPPHAQHTCIYILWNAYPLLVEGVHVLYALRQGQGGQIILQGRMTHSLRHTTKLACVRICTERTRCFDTLMCNPRVPFSGTVLLTMGVYGGQVSVAAASLCVWVHALNRYAYVSRDVEPLQRRLAEAEASAAEMQAILDVKQSELRKIQAHVAELEATLDRTQREKQDLQDQTDLSKKRLERAGVLTTSLAGEKVWDVYMLLYVGSLSFQMCQWECHFMGLLGCTCAKEIRTTSSFSHAFTSVQHSHSWRGKQHPHSSIFTCTQSYTSIRLRVFVSRGMCTCSLSSLSSLYRFPIYIRVFSAAVLGSAVSWFTPWIE